MAPLDSNKYSSTMNV